MFTRKLALLACGAAVLGLGIASSGKAASMVASRTNHLTFSGPVGLPGVTLARGTYPFELIPLHPDILRVLSRDGSKVYFTGFARQVSRPAGLRDDRIVTFAETPRGVAPRGNTWYPMGESTGDQFIYPDAARRYLPAKRRKRSEAAPRLFARSNDSSEQLRTITMVGDAFRVADHRRHREVTKQRAQSSASQDDVDA